MALAAGAWQAPVCLAQTAAAGANGVFALPAPPLNDAPPFSAYIGRPTLIVLFQPSCPYCLLQFREAQAFAATHPDVEVISVSLRGRAADLLAEIRRARSTMPAYRSSPALLQALGSPEGTPRVFAVNQNGGLVAQARGLQNVDRLSVLADRAGGR